MSFATAGARLNYTNENRSHSNEKFDEKVYSDSNANFETCTLYKGVLAQKNISLRKQSKVDGATNSIQGAVEAFHSTLGDIQAHTGIQIESCALNDAIVSAGGLTGISSKINSIWSHNVINLLECSARLVKVLMSGCEAKQSTLEQVEIFEDATFQNCSIQNVKSTNGTITWKNDLALRSQFTCQAVEASKLNLVNIAACSVTSLGGECLASGCIFNAVEAQLNAEISESSAERVTSVRGSVKVYFSDIERAQKYAHLEAHKEVKLNSVKADFVKSRTDAITALKCVLGQVESHQNATIVNSTVKESIKIHVFPNQPVNLILTQSVIEGDIIISSKTAPSEEMIGIDSSRVNTKSTRYYPTDKTEESEPYTDLADLKKKVRNHHGNSTTLLEERGVFDGIVYNYAFGDVQIYQASFKYLISNDNPPEQAPSNPKVAVTIKGGTLKGVVRFEGCDGEVKVLPY